MEKNKESPFWKKDILTLAVCCGLNVVHGENRVKVFIRCVEYSENLRVFGVVTKPDSSVELLEELYISPENLKEKFYSEFPEAFHFYSKMLTQ